MFVEIEQTEVGKTYKVKISDCCVEGYFTSKLIQIVPETEYASPEWHFENGVVITSMFQKCFEEVENV